MLGLDFIKLYSMYLKTYTGKHNISTKDFFHRNIFYPPFPPRVPISYITHILSSNFKKPVK